MVGWPLKLPREMESLVSSKSKRGGFRVMVDANGVNRQVLSISEGDERSNQAANLFIGMMPGIGYQETLEGERREVHARKYSIHPSPRNPDINTIKETIEFLKSPPLTHSHATTAIKKKRQFAPVFIRAYPHLREERYQERPHKRKKIVNLGAFNPDTTTLVLGLFVGPPAMDEIACDLTQVRATTIHFQHYTVRLMSSVLAIKSTKMAPSIHFAALDGIEPERVTGFFASMLPPVLLMCAQMHVSSHAHLL